MKKLMTSITAAAIAIASSGALSNPDDKADQILRQMQEKSRNLKAIQASIVRVRHTTQTNTWGKYTGHLYFKHGGPNKDKIRITYNNNRGEVNQDALIDGDKITLYYPQQHQAFIRSRRKEAKENPEYDFLAAPYNSVHSLKNRYKTAYKGSDRIGDSSMAVIQLTPIGESPFTRVTIWVDQESWFPMQYQVVETNEDVTTITLSDIRRNEKVARDAFKLDLPKGTHIQ